MKPQLLAMAVLATLAMGARDNGCLGPTNETECAEVLCDIACPDGKKLDANGCETCECNAPVVTVCAADADCAAGQACDVTNYCELPPGCREGMECPAVCYGRCVASKDPPPGCWTDSDCADGYRCDVENYCDAAPGCDGGMGCPAVCYGRCVVAKDPPPPPSGCLADSDCAAGETCDTANYCDAPEGCGRTDPSTCDDPESCDGGRACDDVCYGRCVATGSAQALCERTGGKWDPYACGHAKCGIPNACEAIIPGCDCGPFSVFVAGRGCVVTGECELGECTGAWTDERGNCRGPADGSLPAHCCAPQPGQCDDGQPTLCDAIAPTCPAPFIAAARNGCWACVDPIDCSAQCSSDSQCGEGARCVTRTYDPCGNCDPAIGPCCASPAMQYSVCEKATPPGECTTDADCAAGQACRPDPTDPCNGPDIDCFREGRRTCQRTECPGVICDLYCEYGNALDAAGCPTCACNPPPACACSREYAPVCGSDGRTYSNACEAACANVRVASQGECGGSCNIQCLRYDPVCGADGVTYGCGEVEATCNGTTVAYRGECRTACACPAIADPVCGADGRTYGNECELRCANQTVRHDGACGTACGANSDCTWGDKCLTAPDSSRGGECVAADFCYAAADCSGLAPTVSCVGSWSCEANRCAYECRGAP